MEEFTELCEVSQTATVGVRQRRETLSHDAQVLLYRIKYDLMCILVIHIRYNLGLITDGATMH